MEETDLLEAGYVTGRTTAYMDIIEHAAAAAGITSPTVDATRLRRELREVRDELRELWEETAEEGDPFPEDVYLPDVVRIIGKRI